MRGSGRACLQCTGVVLKAAQSQAAPRVSQHLLRSSAHPPVQAAAASQRLQARPGALCLQRQRGGAAGAAAQQRVAQVRVGQVASNSGLWCFPQSSSAVRQAARRVSARDPRIAAHRPTSCAAEQLPLPPGPLPCSFFYTAGLAQEANGSSTEGTWFVPSDAALKARIAVGERRGSLF